MMLKNIFLWVRNELQPLVTNAVISEKLVESPVMVSSMMSTGMRQMVSLMDQSFDVNQFNQNLTMEINPNHETIFKLNELRKVHIRTANLILRHLVDNGMMNAGIPFDSKQFMKRMSKFILTLTDFEIEKYSSLNDNNNNNTVLEDTNSNNNISEDNSGSENLTDSDTILEDALKDFHKEISDDSSEEKSDTKKD